MNVIVTGANRGIGKAIVIAFANAGYNVWACARKPSFEFEKFLNDVSLKCGTWAKPVYFELSDVESINHAMQSILNEEKFIDVLVNNAGISTVKLLSMSKVDDIKSLFDINYFSMLTIIQKISKRMVKQHKGCIINMGSLAGIESQPGKIAYGSSKAAVMLMTRCLAKELGPLGVRVNSIAPGPVETEMIQQYTDKMLDQLAKESSLRRMAKTDEIANVALFLASEQASYINGEIIKVDGGR